ncbi:MAG: Trk system potassium transporter TrkA [Lachnospiraceae bacterium]|nr:Trk system potassium transporter TrkA [Lachnospiraceae bacterium]
MSILGKNKQSRKGLNIIIVGCGKVGSTLVEQLSREGHAITIIDRNPKKVQELAGLYDVMGLAGNGASYSVQMEAGIEDADLLIAVTASDELNLLCCTVAKQAGDCAAIARVRTPDYSKEAPYLREKLGLAMIINPELEAAREAAGLISLPTALEVNSFAHGHAELIQFKIPENNILSGMSIVSMSQQSPVNVLICAVERGGQVHIPSGDFVLESGDIISFAAPREAIRSFLQHINMKTNHARSTLIIGGGRSSYYLANLLLQMGVTVKIIEQNYERCEELSTLLPKATIIHGDGTDADLLQEEGLETVESIVPLTGIDEENIMLTLYARQVSGAKIITKINRPTFKDVISTLDLGSVIYPRLITCEAIVAYVRAKANSMDSNNVETLYHMFDSRAEALEFRIKQASEVTNIPLMELSLKKDLLIACINRGGTIIIPGGQDCIRVGDTVMVVTTHTGFHDIEDILNS